MRIVSYANVASTLALVVALSGTAYAAATITGKDVKNNSLTGKDVKDGSIRNADLGVGALPGATAVLLGGGMIPQGIGDTVTFDTELNDSGGMFTAPGNVITVPRSGTYLLTGAVGFDAFSANRQTRLMVNGDSVVLSAVNGGPTRVMQPATITMPLVAGDQVALDTFTSDEMPIIDYSGTTPDAWLSVQMVSP